MKSGASVRVWHSKKCQLTASREGSRKEWETIHKTQKKEREEQWAHLDITIWGRYEDELRWRSTRDTLAILAPLQLYFKTKPSSECVCACVWLIKRNSTARMNAVLRQFHFSSIKMVVVIEPRMMPTTQSYSWTKADQDRIRSAINQFEEWLVSSSNSCSSGHLRHYTSIASSPSSVGQRKEGRERASSGTITVSASAAAAAHFRHPLRTNYLSPNDLVWVCTAMTQPDYHHCTNELNKLTRFNPGQSLAV